MTGGKEVGGWLFSRGRQEVGAGRLRDSYADGGAQLVDIQDKVRTQRVLWLKRLLSMPEGSFPRVVADELIGPQKFGYFGLASLKGLEGGLKIRAGGFYGGAIKAWSRLGLTYRPGNAPVDGYNLFYNKLITDQGGRILTPREIPRGNPVTTVADLRAAARRRPDYWSSRIDPRCGRATILKYLQMVPGEVEGADAPTFVLIRAGDADLKLSAASFKEVYTQFRSLAKVKRHYEAKWENALNIPLGGQWKDIWETLHHSGASLAARSAVWRQIGLNFWTCYMDHAYIRRGDGICEMCGVFARQRWHTVIECQVVLDLWDKLSATLVRLDNRAVTVREMALGLIGKGDRIRLRNRLGYTLRSAVLGMRWIGWRNVERAVASIWAAFLVQLKRELVGEYWVGRLGMGPANFGRSALIGGVLGKLRPDGGVEWGPLLAEVRVGYWELYR